MKPNGGHGREWIVHLDGTRVFQSETDRQNEKEIAELLSAIWECRVRYFGALSPIDWYAERFGRLVGVLELKARTHEFGRYPSVFLGVRKWLALSLGSVGLGCPAVFVVRFTDGVWWCPVAEIDATLTKVAGREMVQAHNDIEPVIEVQTGVLRALSPFKTSPS